MFGKSRHGASYYACQPERNIGQAADERFPGHGSVWMREDDLLTGLSVFLANRFFGPERRELLAEDLKDTETRADADRVERIAASTRRSCEPSKLKPRTSLSSSQRWWTTCRQPRSTSRGP